ncbi:MAG TPA: ATP-binding protein [Melioribacteraceae bacterium]|nr:ATP-binding protein [Melioribacteraceae bacterium]
MEKDISEYQNNHLFDSFFQILGKKANNYYIIFDETGIILFSNLEVNLKYINEILDYLHFSNVNNKILFSQFIHFKNLNISEIFDEIVINRQKYFSKIICSFNVINYLKYYSIIINTFDNKLSIANDSVNKFNINDFPLGVFTYDANSGKVLEVNKEFCKILNYGKSDILNKDNKNITYPEDYKIDEEINKNLLDGTKEKIEVTKRYISKDGNTIYANIICQLNYQSDEQPNIKVIVLSSTQNEMFLSAEKAKKSLIEKISLTTPDTILIFDVQSQTFTFSNHSLLNEKLGHNNEELTFIRLMSLIHTDDLKKFIDESNLLIVSNDDKIHECSFRLILKNEEVRWLLCRGIVFTRDELGYPEQILLQMTDITSQKELEESLRQSYKQINEKNKILEIQKHELLQAKYELEKSEKQLIEANLNKDKFFSIIAHDLKNPFNSLFGSASFLAQNFEICDKKDVKTLTDNIYNSAKVIYGLLENLLSWARLQTNRLILNAEKINISEVVKNSISLYEETLKTKNIELEIEEDKEIYCYSDKYSLETVIRNLLSNAIKFSFKDGKIVLGFYSNPPNTILYIKDFGVGMSKEKLENVFSLANNTSTNGTMHETGTGLGLLICKEFIEKNKGKIWVESEVNKGTTFFISLPIANP